MRLRENKDWKKDINLHCTQNEVEGEQRLEKKT
jgi:hypothetical protein